MLHHHHKMKHAESTVAITLVGGQRRRDALIIFEHYRRVYIVERVGLQRGFSSHDREVTVSTSHETEQVASRLARFDVVPPQNGVNFAEFPGYTIGRSSGRKSPQLSENPQ